MTTAVLKLKSRAPARRNPPAILEPAGAGLQGMREGAKRDRKRCFTELLHYVDLELLKCAYLWLEEEGVRGGGGNTWTEYGRNLQANLVSLYGRLHRNAHRTLPSWRRFMATAQGQLQPLKRAALKDRIVQRAVAEVLLAVYAADLLEFAHGFRPAAERRAALDEHVARIGASEAHWIVEADLAGFCEAINHKSLLRCLEQRIADSRVLDLIRRWLKAGVMDDAALATSGTEALQGSIAPVLANLYLHHAFDLWAVRWCHYYSRGTVSLLREADYIVVAFQHKAAARRFLTELRGRLQQFVAALHPQKARLIGLRRYMRERPP